MTRQQKLPAKGLCTVCGKKKIAKKRSKRMCAKCCDSHSKRMAAQQAPTIDAVAKLLAKTPAAKYRIPSYSRSVIFNPCGGGSRVMRKS